MHDKSHASANPIFELSGQRVIAMDGRDAASFAQAQFMNDLNGLQPGQWHWNGWLSPKGRVLALFALLKWADQRVWLLAPDADAIALAEGLKRFLFRSKVAIEVRNDLRVVGEFAAPATARDNTFSGEEGSGVELDMGAEGGPRCLRIAPHVLPAGTGVALEDVGGLASWKSFDLEHGLPRLPASQAEQWTPQQLSLDRLRGFSVKKGCYPGQEIVARTHFLGKAKRGLVLLEGEAPVAEGSDVRSGDATLGTVIASVDADGRHLALAVLPLGRDTSALTVDGRLVREGALKAGLAR